MYFYNVYLMRLQISTLECSFVTLKGVGEPSRRSKSFQEPFSIKILLILDVGISIEQLS
jgi:hypothetical protein